MVRSSIINLLVFNHHFYTRLYHMNYTIIRIYLYRSIWDEFPYQSSWPLRWELLAHPQSLRCPFHLPGTPAASPRRLSSASPTAMVEVDGKGRMDGFLCTAGSWKNFPWKLWLIPFLVVETHSLHGKVWWFQHENHPSGWTTRSSSPTR